MLTTILLICAYLMPIILKNLNCHRSRRRLCICIFATKTSFPIEFDDDKGEKHESICCFFSTNLHKDLIYVSLIADPANYVE